MIQIPSVGQIVHYVSYGTPGGEYRSQCRAAIVTSVEPIEQPADKAHLIEEGYDVSLCVLNPEGQFFNQHVPYYQWDSNEASEGLKPKGGTWHWPERTEIWYCQDENCTASAPAESPGWVDDLGGPFCGGHS